MPVAEDRGSVWVDRGSRGGASRALRVAFLAPPLLAVLILLISVSTPAGPSASGTVAPSFDGARAATFARRFSQLVPDRSPGSATAGQAADDIASALSENSGEAVHRSTFTAPGPTGEDVTMQNVWVVEPGASKEAIVILAHRDNIAPGPGLDDNASGTSALVELARSLSGVERARALVLASTDGGTVGQAGAKQLLPDLIASGLRPVVVVALDSIGSPDGELPIRFAGTGGVRTPDSLLRGLEEALGSQPEAGEAGPENPILQVLDLIAPVTPQGAQAPFLGAGVASIQLGDGNGGVGLAAIGEQRFGGVGAAVGSLLVRLDAEPRPAPPSGVYIAVSGRVLPGRAIALLALALLVGPLFAAGSALLTGRPSRVGWGSALLVAAIGALPGIATVLIARSAELAGGITTLPGSGRPRADNLTIVLVIGSALLAVIIAAYLLKRRFRTPMPLVAAPITGLGAAALLLAGSPASVLIAVPALWLWTLVPRPEDTIARLAWGLGPVLGMGLVFFILRGADVATLVGAAGVGALPAGLVVGASALAGAGVVGVVGVVGTIERWSPTR